MELQYWESLSRQHPIKKNKRRKRGGSYSENLRMNDQLGCYCQYFPQCSASIRKIKCVSCNFTGVTPPRYFWGSIEALPCPTRSKWCGPNPTPCTIQLQFWTQTLSYGRILYIKEHRKPWMHLSIGQSAGVTIECESEHTKRPARFYSNIKETFWHSPSLTIV